EDGIRDFHVTGVQTCALPILTADHVAAVLALLDGVGAVDVPGGVRARRAGDRIRLERPPSGPAVAPAGPAPPAFFHPLDVPGKRSEERRVGEGGRVCVAASLQ